MERARPGPGELLVRLKSRYCSDPSYRSDAPGMILMVIFSLNISCLMFKYLLLNEAIIFLLSDF